MPVLEQPTDVLRQFSHGDLDAFEALFRTHQSEVYGWIVRIVRDPAAAEDLTLETFWRIHRAHARFDYLKSARPEADLPDDLVSPVLPDPGVSEELRRKTARAFGRLPPKLRVAATLALIEEQPYKEIAEALGISTSAVKVRVFRAVRFLRDELKRQGIEP